MKKIILASFITSFVLNLSCSDQSSLEYHNLGKILLDAAKVEEKEARTLMDAIKLENDKQIIISKIEQGADVNYQDPETGNTSLHYAIKSSNAAMVKLLKKHNASSTILNKEGLSANDMIAKEFCDAQKALNEAEAREEALKKQIAFAQKCIEKYGADYFNQEDK